MVAISASWAEAPAGEDTAAISASWAEAPIKDPLDGPAEPEPCSFCPGGIDDPSGLLSADNGATCGSLKAHFATAAADDLWCSMARLAEDTCCPDYVRGWGPFTQPRGWGPLTQPLLPRQGA